MSSYRDLLMLYALQVAREDGLITSKENADDLLRRLEAWDLNEYKTILTSRRDKLLRQADGNEFDRLYSPGFLRSQAQSINEMLFNLANLLSESS